MSPRILIWHSGVFGMSAVFVGLLILATQPDQPVTEKIAPTETEQTVEALPAISKAEANPDANARLATMPVAVSMLAPDADTPRPSLRDVSDDVPLPVPLTIPELPEPRPKLAVFLVTDTPDAKEWQRREQPRLERTGWTFGSRNLVRYVDGSVTASRSVSVRPPACTSSRSSHAPGMWNIRPSTCPRPAPMALMLGR